MLIKLRYVSRFDCIMPSIMRSGSNFVNKYFFILSNKEFNPTYTNKLPCFCNLLLTDQIYDIAEKIAKAGKLIGVCGIEFFITEDEEVFVNEIAPRPHNTGHYTIEATNVSQFDQHILGITGRSLINIRLFEPGLMINILGQHLPYVEKVSQQYPEAIYHIYDKGEAKKQ